MDNRLDPDRVYRDKVTRRIGRTLSGKQDPSDTYCLDAADLMPAALRDAFYRGTLEYLSAPERLDDILRRLDGVPNDPAWPDPVCGQ